MEDYEDEQDQIDTEEVETGEEGTEEVSETGDLDTGEGDDGFTIEVDGVAAEEDNLVKSLRAQLREAKRQIHSQGPAPVQKIEVGEKPRIEDFDWDADKFEAAIDAWHDRKRQADAQEAEQQRIAAEGQKRFDDAHKAYRQKATALGVKDYDTLEAQVDAVLPAHLRNFIPMYMGDDGPKTVVALGRHPQLIDRLTSIQDPVAQLWELAKIANGVKVMPRKNNPPESESIQRGGVATSGSSDKHLERLEKEAERTGDRTKLIDYRRKMRAA